MTDPSATIREISITFPEGVRLTRTEEQVLQNIAARACKRYVADNPGRTMWPAGFGARPLNIMTCGDDDPLKFQEGSLCIDCYERADYDWPCALCGQNQGDHKSHILNPPAGNCKFVPAKKST